MKRFKTILCASLLTLAMSSATMAGNITLNRSGNITLNVNGNITLLSETDATSMLLTTIIG
jgi:hypothetical protein